MAKHAGSAVNQNVGCGASGFFVAPAARLAQPKRNHVTRGGTGNKNKVSDWRNRLVNTITNDGTNEFQQKPTLDNLGRATKNETFRNGSGTLVLVAKSESFFDERGKQYRSKSYAVSDAGVAGNALESNQWYDANGQAIKSSSPGSEAFTKSVYDAVGRATTVYSAYYDGAGSDDPTSIAANVVLSESQTTYDDASHVLMSTSKDRLHNATGNGSLNGPSGSQPKSRDSYSAMWYDEIGRSIASASYGTNGGSAVTRPDSAPASSDTILVSQSEFNIKGQAEKSTDPAGDVVKAEFDDAGRTTKTIRNFGGSVTETVRTEYNSDGQMSKQIAENVDTGNQETVYTYGVTVATGSDLASNQLLEKMTHPDSGVVSYDYDRSGQQTSMTDANGSVHDYAYDDAGRRVTDTVSTLASGVDGSVRRIEHSYDDRMRLENITSYDATTAGNVQSDVQYSYNDFGQVTAEYQQHNTAVNISTSPVVEYNYENGSSNSIRMSKLTYPDGRELDYDYGTAGSINDRLDRLATIEDGATTLVTYQHSGAGMVVSQTYNQPGIEKTLALGSGSDPYSALDRFGRMIDLRWKKGSTDLVRFEYDYDRVSNRLNERNLVSTGSNPDVDGLFGFDELNRLTSFKTGMLNTGGDAIASPDMTQSFTLDETGNNKGFTQTDIDAVTQTRTHNDVNEITNITETVGDAWVTPTHEAAGNMTTIPQPSDLTSGYDPAWDAWHRLVALEDAGNSVAVYHYDGMNRRIVMNQLPQVGGIDVGYQESDIVILPDMFAGSANDGEYQATGTYFKTGPASGDSIAVTSMGAGIFGLDDAAGSGYMMYSAQKVHQRFTGIPSSLAYHLVVVRLNGSQWQYCNNATWINFTPVASDRLLAELDFDNDTVKMLGWKQVYYSSASQALEERVGSEADAASQYVWNLGYVDDLVLRDRDTDSSGSVDERLYSLPDLRFSVMALASSTGAIVERFKYDAHGVVSVLDSAFASRTDSNYDWEFRHTGRRTDLETGLQFFRARYYSPELARFISRDPLGFVDGMSLYRAYFVPGGMDPFGEFTQVNDDRAPWVTAEPGSKFCCTYKDTTGKTWSWTLGGFSHGETPWERCNRRLQGVWGGWTSAWFVVGAKKGECPKNLTPPDFWTQGYGSFCGPTRRGYCTSNGLPHPWDPPLDALDLACFRHDCCVGTVDEWLDQCNHRDCNEIFCQALLAVDCSKSPTPKECEWYRAKAATLTCGTIGFPVKLP